MIDMPNSRRVLFIVFGVVILMILFSLLGARAAEPEWARLTGNPAQASTVDTSGTPERHWTFLTKLLTESNNPAGLQLAQQAQQAFSSGDAATAKSKLEEIPTTFRPTMKPDDMIAIAFEVNALLERIK